MRRCAFEETAAHFRAAYTEVEEHGDDVRYGVLASGEVDAGDRRRRGDLTGDEKAAAFPSWWWHEGWM